MPLCFHKVKYSLTSAALLIPSVFHVSPSQFQVTSSPFLNLHCATTVKLYWCTERGSVSNRRQKVWQTKLQVAGLGCSSSALFIAEKQAPKVTANVPFHSPTISAAHHTNQHWAPGARRWQWWETPGLCIGPGLVWGSDHAMDFGFTHWLLANCGNLDLLSNSPLP